MFKREGIYHPLYLKTNPATQEERDESIWKRGKPKFLGLPEFERSFKEEEGKVRHISGKTVGKLIMPEYDFFSEINIEDIDYDNYDNYDEKLNNVLYKKKPAHFTIDDYVPKPPSKPKISDEEEKGWTEYLEKLRLEKLEKEKKKKGLNLGATPFIPKFTFKAKSVRSVRKKSNVKTKKKSQKRKVNKKSLKKSSTKRKTSRK